MPTREAKSDWADAAAYRRRAYALWSARHPDVVRRRRRWRIFFFTVAVTLAVIGASILGLF